MSSHIKITVSIIYTRLVPETEYQFVQCPRRQGMFSSDWIFSVRTASVFLALMMLERSEKISRVWTLIWIKERRIDNIEGYFP